MKRKRWTQDVSHRHVIPPRHLRRRAHAQKAARVAITDENLAGDLLLQIVHEPQRVNVAAQIEQLELRPVRLDEEPRRVLAEAQVHRELA